MKHWYTITNKGEAAPAEVSIFGPIGNTWDGEGVTARQFIEDFRAIKAKDVTLTVNSPGGSLFDGLTIYTALASSGKNITAKVMGLAASAASLVVMAASKITMPKNTHLMIHKAGNVAWGNADDMREMADVLDSLDASIANTYAARTGKSVDEIKAMLDSGDTWLNAEQAVEMGFADEATDLVRVTAEFDLDKLPEAIRNALKPPSPPTPLADEVLALAKAAGIENLAAAIALDPAITDAAAARAAVNAALEIHAYAKLAGKPEQADTLVRARKTVAEARAELAAAAEAEDRETRVDTAPRATKKQAAADEFSVGAVWNEIRAMKAGSKQ